MSLCTICPRECSVDRSISLGYCGESDKTVISKIMLHHWEEPCISGKIRDKGSGAVFFSGCSLKCVYCQNRDISRGGNGKEYSAQALSDVFLSLQEQGALNINLITPTHFTLQIIEALALIKDRLYIPVIWNTSGYEKVSTVKLLQPYVDIFLTDFKYSSPKTALRYSAAENYCEVAEKALYEMINITGKPLFENDMMKKGVIVRHLVLPGSYKESIEVLNIIERTVGHNNIVLSLMSQYTPEFLQKDYKELSRRITTFEYEKVSSYAVSIGFSGYFQSRSSASAAYTPDFSCFS